LSKIHSYRLSLIVLLFVVALIPVAFAAFSDGTSTATSATVTGLTNNVSYDFRVSAVNSVGTGPASSTATATPIPATEPDAPTSLTATSGDTQVSLSWTAPSDGGVAISDYIIEFRTGSDSFAAFSDGTSTATSATVTGLTNNVSYDFRVSAVNSVGTGPVSSTATATPTSLAVIVVRVSASTDDAEEKSDGKMTLTSTDLELTRASSTQQIGMRFNGLTIPNGATITSAYIQFQVDETTSETTNLTISGEDVDNSTTFTTTAYDITNRTTTGEYVDWSVPAWSTEDEVGDDQKTPDLKTIAQEIVDRAGWSSGNSMSFIVTGDGKRVAESYDGDSSAAPLLTITYVRTEPTEPDAPTSLTATLGDTQVSLSWTAPSDGGEAITDYIIEYSSDSGTSWTTFADGTSTATSAIVSGGGCNDCIPPTIEITQNQNTVTISAWEEKGPYYIQLTELSLDTARIQVWMGYWLYQDIPNVKEIKIIDPDEILSTSDVVVSTVDCDKTIECLQVHFLYDLTNKVSDISFTTSDFYKNSVTEILDSNS